MRIRWTGKAREDLARLYEFLADADPTVAGRIVRSLVAAPARLLDQPRLGMRLEEFAPREARRILIGRYEMRYAIESGTIYVLRFWHSREDR